jgi:N utilization substance protein A
MEKIANIIESIALEKGLELDDAKEAVSNALTRTAKQIFGEEYEYAVELDEETKELALFQKQQVVADDDPKMDEVAYNGKPTEKYIELQDAKELNSELEVGDELTYKISLNDMGRTAAAVLYKELEYHIQRVVERNIFDNYKDRIGDIINIRVTQIDADENTYGEFKEVRAILPMKSRIKGEKFKLGDTMKSIIRRVYIDKKTGMQVELSRTSPKFLEEMLALEVPEIKDELVIIHNSARIPGERAKIALSAVSPNIDAIGATVGTRGIRINAVSRELHNENIDCIEYTAIPEKFVSRALSPAIISAVRIENGKAIVTLPSDQKSKAIGKSGINIRLASMLTGFEIELVEQKGTQTTMSDSSNQNQPKENSGDALKALFGD